ncbi:uncharacterized protein [Porites lutea]|uniref:uncharacterized protein n=1 Tax=Porites lutea TaxID=51062 RepID=UPI003CC5DBF1
MKFVDPIESESTRERTPSQDAYDSDEEIFEKTITPAVEVCNMSTVDCQATANSQDDEEAGIIDKAEKRRMKFPCPPGPTQAAESNESNKLHNNGNCSFQDGGKITDPRSQPEDFQLSERERALASVADQIRCAADVLRAPMRFPAPTRPLSKDKRESKGTSQSIRKNDEVSCFISLLHKQPKK